MRIVAQVFKLGLWSALVFFEHGSEAQLATALVINVIWLCVHIYAQPFGGEDSSLLNALQSGTLIITVYINFGGLCKCREETSRDSAECAKVASKRAAANALPQQHANVHIA